MKEIPHPWIGPAGTILSTAEDMARYMRAHVLEGEEGGYPLVSKEMFHALHSERFRNAPISIGFAHAFWTTELSGAGTIEHGGGTPNYFIPGLADQVWAPASPIFNPVVMLQIFLLCGAVVLSGLLLFAWPNGRRFSSRTNYLALIIALCVLTFPLAILFGFEKGDGLINQMALGQKARFWMMVAAANLVTIATVALLAVRVASTLHSGGSDGPAWARIGHACHALIVTIAALGIVLVFGFFRFLGINMPG